MEGDVGLLLSLPTESLAVRVAVASVVAVLMARMLSDSWIRGGRARASLALVPAASMVVVIGLYVTAPAMPAVWHTIDAAGGLTVPVRDTYLSFAPATLPFVLAVWGAVAAVRVGVRSARHRLAVRELCRLASSGGPADDRVVAIVARLAAALRIAPPQVSVVPSLPGGAAVVGVRSPRLLIDATLLAALDEQELTGVVAHELAHVQRRDNLVAFLLGVLRDALFFVPGGGWSLRMLLREREHVADHIAADITGRPAALAGGLLKVLEVRGSTAQHAACAPLLSEGTLVARVEALIDDRPPATRTQRFGEGAAVAGATGLAVLAAAVLPSLIAGPAHQRDALGVLLSSVDTSAIAPTSGRAAVFRSFEGRRGATSVAATQDRSPGQDGLILDVGTLDSAGAAGFAACARGDAACVSDQAPRVSLPSRPIVRLGDAGVDSWRLEPIVRSVNQESALFWFSRLATS